ncbi:hypothetical protein AB0R11_03445, partial [Streptomyces fradiae]|uniref:hypothetical protein n=1 Tax=Streptomyces fradiae TaxID=1906 RepID=UPI00342D3F15
MAPDASDPSGSPDAAGAPDAAGTPGTPDGAPGASGAPGPLGEQHSDLSGDEPLLAARVHRPSDLLRLLANLFPVVAALELKYGRRVLPEGSLAEMTR